MNNEILNSILKDFSSKRQRAIDRADRNLEKALKNEEYKKVDKEIRNLRVDIGKQKFLGNSTTEMEKQMIDLSTEANNLLTEIGISPTSIYPEFECDNCKDQGFVDGEMCNCLKQAYYNRLMENSNLTINDLPEFEDCTLKGEENEKVLEILKSYTQKFEKNQKKNLLLIGQTGVGKTFLTKCVANEVLKQGKTVFYTSSFNLNNIFLNIHTSKETEKLKLINNLLDVELLIIDDLGTETIYKNITREYLLVLLNERNAKNLATIISTNFMPANIIDIYGERIHSRLFDKKNTTTLKINGNDQRVSK